MQPQKQVSVRARHLGIKSWVRILSTPKLFLFFEWNTTNYITLMCRISSLSPLASRFKILSTIPKTLYFTVLMTLHKFTHSATRLPLYSHVFTKLTLVYGRVVVKNSDLSIVCIYFDSYMSLSVKRDGRALVSLSFPVYLDCSVYVNVPI